MPGVESNGIHAYDLIPTVIAKSSVQVKTHWRLRKLATHRHTCTALRLKDIRIKLSKRIKTSLKTFSPSHHNPDMFAHDRKQTTSDILSHKTLIISTTLTSTPKPPKTSFSTKVIETVVCRPLTNQTTETLKPWKSEVRNPMKPFVHKKAAGGLTNKNREKIRSADRVNNQRLLFPVS